MWMVVVLVLAVAAVGVLIASLVVAERELREKTQRLEILESQGVSSVPEGREFTLPDDIERQLAALRKENTGLLAQIHLKQNDTSSADRSEGLEGLGEQLRDAEEQGFHYKEENSRLIAQVAGLKKEREASQEVIRSLEDLQERLPATEREISGLRQENSRLSTENHELKGERDRIRSRIQELEKLQSQVPQAEYRMETLLRENVELQLQVAELRRERENGDEKIQQLEKELERLPELSQNVADLRHENSRLEARLENMKSSLRQKIESQLSGLQELHHQLENSVQPEKGL